MKRELVFREMRAGIVRFMRKPEGKKMRKLDIFCGWGAERLSSPLAAF